MVLHFFSGFRLGWSFTLQVDSGIPVSNLSPQFEPRPEARHISHLGWVWGVVICLGSRAGVRAAPTAAECERAADAVQPDQADVPGLETGLVEQGRAVGSRLHEVGLRGQPRRFKGVYHSPCWWVGLTNVS